MITMRELPSGYQWRAVGKGNDFSLAVVKISDGSIFFSTKAQDLIQAKVIDGADQAWNDFLVRNGLSWEGGQSDEIRRSKNLGSGIQ